ncbi:MAG: RNA polymerase factor sigma-54 [Deltaproteobacteria bacterium]|nr:RNA polymerase factor sigma-54 [Deltaproteobacteria bacterium]
MGMDIKQQLRLSQQLVMTPQLQQAIKLLQLSRIELVDMVRDELLENPVLEDSLEIQPDNRKVEGGVQERADAAEYEAERVGETDLHGSETATDRPEGGGQVQADDTSGEAVREFDWESYLANQAMAAPMPGNRPLSSDDMPSLEANLTRGTSLFGHLEWQLKLSSRFTENQAGIALLLIGNLTPDGYLDIPLEDVAEEAECSVEEAENVLKLVQILDPPGVGARDLRECLLIQARHLEADDEIVVAIIEKHLGNMERQNYALIARDLNQPLDEIYEAAKVIKGLDPKPGSVYTDDEPTYVTPDVYIYKIGEQYFVVANDDGLPKLKISDFYRAALAAGDNAKDYIQERLRSAQWLIRSIQQRQRTIVRVTESILKFQKEFFERGAAHLRPLILRDVADDIGMHESTVSRVTTNKYVHTQQGIFELKYFFNSGISRSDGDDLASEAVKLKIRQLVGAEDVRHPHSDQKLVELLAEQNIEIARRTVAKYREQLRILPSSRRKVVF